MIIDRHGRCPVEEYFGTGEAARRAGIARSRLIYLLERGAIPPPSLALPGRRLFTAADIDRIRAALARLPRPNEGG